MSGTIACPNCGHEFEISDALTGQIRDHLRAELSAEAAKREAEARKKLADLEAREQKLDEQVAERLKEQLARAEAKTAKQFEERYALQMRDLRDTLRQR
ncbi:MAG: hypothetical protein KDM91_19645, partial [Verrucomicrobiae bacterium]|nr:hypothetical protein [Verrucomicrobiae bacterium]